MLLSIGQAGHSVLQRAWWRPFPSRFNLLTHRPRFIVRPATARRRHEIVSLPIGLSGDIKLDIFLPSSLEGHSGQTQRNVLVYLPPGPSLGQSLQPWSAVDQQTRLLALASPSTTIVTINYRLRPSVDSEDAEASSFNHYPTPIHDVAEGLHFLASESSQFNEGQDFMPKFSLLGNRLGGALAAMLALTQPNDIHALTIIEPMVDWVGLDEVVKHLRDVTSDIADTSRSTLKKTARKRNRALNFPGVDNKSVLAAAEELLSLRSTFFKTPSAYFDPFASPMLFLRAPGRDTPLDTAGDLLMRELGIEHAPADDDNSFGPYDDDWSQNSSAMDPDGEYTEQLPSSDSEAGFVSDVVPQELNHQNNYPSPLGAQQQPRRRKVLRRWPSVGRPEDVLLPRTKIFLRSGAPFESADKRSVVADQEQGLQSLLYAQGMEFAELMRRACFYGRESGFANERVLVHDVGKGEVSSEFERDDALSTNEQAILWADQVLKED